METATPSPEQLAAVQQSVLARFRNLFVALAIGYGVICALSTLLVAYMRRNRSVAFRGDASAARKIILPAFLPLLLLLSFVSFAFSAYFCATLLFVDITVTASKVETEAYYAGRLFVVVVTMVYMYQKSVTTPALLRAAMISLLLCTYSLPVVWYTSTYCSSAIAYYVPTFARLPVPLLFAWAYVSPPARASKRAIREYCAFVFVYYALFVAYSDLFHQNRLDIGFTVCFLNIFWGSLCPLVIWRILKADTEHWRGLGQRAVALQSLFRQKNNLDERISSRGLHVLIEMHRKYIIDFAYLELKQRIGVGSSAVVYNGVLNSKVPVAIKVYTPTELLDETVAEFSHEAALCGALNHPNIVKFYGMCVCPPTICLVSELCQGSLDDVTRALARRKHDARRQQLAIDLQYMIDATRAVAYLHSFSPAFLHRDIKPANFLVDSRCVVKLTDFGESRSIPKACQAGSSSSSSSSSGSGTAATSSTGGANGTHRMSTGENVWSSFQTPMPAAEMPVRNAMTVRGTADYMAPEIIQGRAGTAMYFEAADVYSLAITLWDIVHPLSEKYPDANGNHFKIFESVLGGKRPPIGESCHPEVKCILNEAWEAQPDKRPSAQYILTRLETLKQEVVSDIAATLAESIEKKVFVTKKETTTEKSITGQLLMQRMLEFGFVESADEACRMGNGLMSAGFLHHVRHLEPFTKSTELFAFDEEMIESFTSNGLHKFFVPPLSLDEDSAGATHVSELVQPKYRRVDSYLSTASTATVGERHRLSSASLPKTSTQPHHQSPYLRRANREECSCPKLGRGQGVQRARRRRFRRHNKKWYATVEGGNNVLTEKLLMDALDHTGESTLDDVMHNSDLEAAILHDSDADDDGDDDDDGEDGDEGDDRSIDLNSGGADVGGIFRNTQFRGPWRAM